MSCECYALETLPRLMGFPLKLELVGWAKNHRMEEPHTLVNYNYVCFSFNRKKYDVNLKDDRPSLGMLPIGTYVDAASPYHDEVFFGYPLSARELLFKLFGADKRISIKIPTLTDEIKAIIKEIRAKLDMLDTPGAADALDLAAISLIRAVITAQYLESAGRKTINMNLYELAYELKQGKNLQELIRKYGFSKQTLYNEWNQVFPVSPAQYRIQETLKQAKALLRETDMPIKEVCEHCNFSSLIYFYQFFRKHTGISPLAFRKAQNGTPAGTEG